MECEKHPEKKTKERVTNQIKQKNIIEKIQLINEFYKITGIPVLINTSMNVKGEPIVNTPEQAYNMLTKTDMDYLVIGNCI